MIQLIYLRPRAALAALFFSILWVCAPGQAPAKATDANQKAYTWDRPSLLSLAARIVDAAPRLATIWPGYWPPQQPFIMYVPAKGALLVSTGQKPDSFEAMVGPDVPQLLKGRAFWHSGDLSDVKRPFVIGYPIGGGTTAILADAARKSPETLTSLLLHEQFHGYQKSAFEGGGVSQFVDPLAISDRVAFAASAEIERRVLAKALGVEDPKARRELLQQYFSLRREREAAMPGEVVKVERGFERTEGTARYVDRAALAAIDGDPKRLPASLKTELLRPLASATGAFASHWFRSRSYSTGAAITYFISRLDRGDWRTKIEHGAAPDELLESLLGKPAAGQRAKLARNGRISFGYDAILRELEPAIRAGEKAEIKSVEEFLAPSPYRLILEAKAAGKGSVGFNGMNMAQLAQGTMALPKAEMFNFSAPSVSLSTRQLPVLMEEGQRFTVLLPSAPEIIGLNAPALGNHRLNSAIIRSNGIDLKVDKPVIVSISETSMTIRVRE